MTIVLSVRLLVLFCIQGVLLMRDNIPSWLFGDLVDVEIWWWERKSRGWRCSDVLRTLR
jgi:hypothetical protein